MNTACGLAYSDTGGTGPAVLFVHGVGTAGCAWRPQVAALAGRFRCLTFDNRGVGDSPPAAGPVTVADMAADARAVLDAAGVESAHVVGHSLGGPVALHLAHNARPRVRSLALLCTFADGRRVGPLSWRLVWAGMRSQVGPRRTRRRGFLELILPPAALRDADPAALAADLAGVFGRDLADPPAVVPRQMKAMRAFDATPYLGELAGLPTLVVSAAHDLIAPSALGRALAAGIPGSRFVELADASHGATAYRPDPINALIAAHLAG